MLKWSKENVMIALMAGTKHDENFSEWISVVRESELRKGFRRCKNEEDLIKLLEKIITKELEMEYKKSKYYISNKLEKENKFEKIKNYGKRKNNEERRVNIRLKTREHLILEGMKESGINKNVVISKALKLYFKHIGEDAEKYIEIAKNKKNNL